MTKIKIALATTIHTDAALAMAAAKALNGKIPGAIDLSVLTGGDFRKLDGFEEFLHFSQQAHIIIVHLMGDLPGLARLAESAKNKGVPLIVVTSLFSGNREATALSTVQSEDLQKISNYLNYGGEKNFYNLLLYIANRFVGTSFEVAAPVKPYWEGIYHPDFDHVPALDEYVAKKINPQLPTVGIWFHQGHWQNANTNFIDSLIREIEHQGANALPVFLSSSKNPALGINGLEWIINNYFLKDGKPIVDVVISALSFSLTTSLSDADASATLKKLGVPIIKAITTYNTFDEWHSTPQ
jgi:cobaltochelatase CobN